MHPITPHTRTYKHRNNYNITMLYYMYMHIHRFQGLLLVDQVIVLILLCPEFLPKYIYIYLQPLYDSLQTQFLKLQN